MKKKELKITSNCCQPNTSCCTPTNNLPRKDFLKLSALGATAFAMPLSACDFVSKTKYGHLIPADKMLSLEWVKSLTERGIPEVYSSLKDELKYIGMPIGGVGCGQLYISGDGRLWLWDIFQSNYNREAPTSPNHPDVNKRWRLDEFSMGGLYPKPRTSSKENNLFQVKNGFSVQYQQADSTNTLRLDSEGFDNISFRGEYPIAKVSYKKNDTPLSVDLTAYSPFIPLNIKDSSIPVTVLSYKITNNSKETLKLNIGGWLENTVCPNTDDIDGRRKNIVISENGKTTVFMTASGEGLKKRKGYGNMAISLLGNQACNANPNLDEEFVFEQNKKTTAETSLSQSLIGSVSTLLELQPNESKTITFLISWYFPHYNIDASGSGVMGQIKDFNILKRNYALHYNDANEVAIYVSKNFEKLSSTTLKWNETWYNSTLPYWFLDRSFISIDCLATQTSHLFNNGRFWGWEGVDCCEGTCTHVWQYAQGMARIFPSLERNLREKVDYSIGYSDKGTISFRAENLDNFTGGAFAIDGQLGTIIRVYREHQMSIDDAFLTRIWDKVKQSMRYIIAQDNGNGLIEGKQPHTLDSAWYGPMGWITGLYLAALKACEQMALEIGDDEFATSCNRIIPIGQKNMVDKLFNGNYFIHLPPDYNSINTNKGCHIDQVLGQSFGYQVNLPDVLPQKETRSALKSLWKYNFSPDAGQYALDHKEIKGDRLYVMPGEAGLIMTTWPLGGDDKAVPGMTERPDNSEFWIGPGGYFDECMNGFEYQVASHLVWEDMLTEGLSIMKAVHERYNGSKRNPYDEVECSSHYARSMASYGTYLAACGYHYHGPKGELGFDPKIHPEDFKCAFTTAESWGTFIQKISNEGQENMLKIEYGKLKLKSFSIIPKHTVKELKITVNNTFIDSIGNYKDGKYKISFKEQELSLQDHFKIETWF
jgi:non-lysosomal glucosylceramidase